MTTDVCLPSTVFTPRTGWRTSCGKCDIREAFETYQEAAAFAAEHQRESRG